MAFFADNLAANSRQLGARVGSTEGIRSLSTRKPMGSNPDFTTEHSSLLGSSESLESLQEPDWLKDAAHTLVASSEGAALDLTGAAKAALQRSEETLELMRKANEKLAAERHAAALSALAVSEQHAEECARTQAVVAAARAQAQRAQVTATAAAAWSRLGSEAARSAAQAEVERLHAALAVHRSSRERRANDAASRAQAVLAASADKLERMRRELCASREAGEQDAEAGAGGLEITKHTHQRIGQRTIVEASAATLS